MKTMKIKNPLIFVILITLLICVSLGIAVWDMNFWPNDTGSYYFEAALSVPHLNHLSEIHQVTDVVRARWLHGKEVYIASSAFMQYALKDYETLRPFLVLGLIAIGLSGILIFLIARSFFSQSIAVVCWGLFSTSFWPYLYVLFNKHQTLGLLLFLISVYSLNFTSIKRWGKVFYAFSGMAIGAALFSSTVTTLYFFLYTAAVAFRVFNNSRAEGSREGCVKDKVVSVSLVLIGFMGMIGYINYPNILHNIYGFVEYVALIRNYNHFFYNQPVLQQWISHDIEQTRGGWLWVFKYFLMAMPVLFPMFLFCLCFLLKKFIKGKAQSSHSLGIIGVVFLSISSPLLAEFSGIAQYGSNYFPSIVGIIFLIGATLKIISNSKGSGSVPIMKKAATLPVLIIVFMIHVAANMYIFLSDVYPTRMATTLLSEKIKELGITHLYTYQIHPYNKYIYGQLNPRLKANLSVSMIKSMAQPDDGVILIPPVTIDSIYHAAKGDTTNFDHDIFLNEILVNGDLNDYAIASFKTLVSSRIWPNEQETLTYRYLILNQFSQRNVELGKVWLIDAKKLEEAKNEFSLSNEYYFMLNNRVRNIGTKNLIYMYKGTAGSLPKASMISAVTAKIYKVGNPSDSLKAYVFKKEKIEPEWIPVQRNNASKAIGAVEIESSLRGATVRFEFEDPLKHGGGEYFIVIYRTGSPDDNNFYRIYSTQVGLN